MTTKKTGPTPAIRRPEVSGTPVPKQEESQAPSLKFPRPPSGVQPQVVEPAGAVDGVDGDVIRAGGEGAGEALRRRPAAGADPEHFAVVDPPIAVGVADQLHVHVLQH